MHTAVRLGIVTLLGIASAVAQERPRRTMLGSVGDAAGAPVAGAEVRLAFVPVGNEHQPAVDIIDAVTDARGRFRARLWPCALYRVWALGPAGADGRRTVSEVEWISAAGQCELRLAFDYAPQTIALAGIERWQDDGPFQVRWLIHGVELPTPPLAVDGEGNTPLPPLPATACSGEVLNGNGHVFETFTMNTRAPRAKVTIDPPFEVPMRAIDANDKPVAGVEIWQRIRSAWSTGDLYGPYPPTRFASRRLGSTDAEGRLTARVAARKDPTTDTGWQQLTFEARKAGFATSISGYRRNPFAGDTEIEREGLEALPFHMHPRQPLRGILVDGSRICADAGLAITWEHQIKQVKNNSTMSETVSRTLRTDREGHFELDGLPQKLEGCRIVLLPDVTALAGFPESVHRTVPPQPFGLHGDQPDPGKQWKIDLGATHRLELQVLDDTGGPARGARVMAFSRATQLSCDWTAPQAVLEGAGRLTLRLQAGKWLVFVRGATSMASLELDLEGSAKHQLKLAPMPAMHGVVVDGDGKPIANAELNCHSSTYHSGNNHSELEPIASTLNWRWIDAVRTDAQGRFVCAYLDMPNMYYEARFEKNGKQSTDFRIRVTEEPETITIR